MALVNDRKGALKKLKTLAFSSKSETNSFREKIEKTFYTPVLPNRVEYQEVVFGNVPCDVLSPEIYASNRVVLYVHGGSFVGGSRASYRCFCSSLASKACARVVIPEFRLAPAFPYPSALEDIQSVFRALYTEEQVTSSLGNDKDSPQASPEFIIAADGSGASIALALLFNLRERYRQCISNVVLFSPWLNLSSNSPILSAKKMSDDIITSDVLRKSSAVYTYEANAATSFVSPLLASDEQLLNFPPVFIQMGDTEILKDDAVAFTERLKSLGNVCELDLWPDMMFMFQMADDCLHESHLAMDKIGKILTGSEGGKSTVKVENKPRLEESIKSEA
ncbi:MAG: alpha/beta hydrolase [Treponema sp.]|nr:alpha/beta hydrolase [Treponema sp.]